MRYLFSTAFSVTKTIKKQNGIVTHIIDNVVEIQRITIWNFEW